jgi:hypothetical protein
MYVFWYSIIRRYYATIRLFPHAIIIKTGLFRFRNDKMYFDEFKANYPDLKAVNIKTTIANNIITLERTKMKIAGFRPRFEGQVSFDGRLNLSGRLGLPPFGIFGIPFSVTGTQENPTIKLRHAKDSDKIEETEEAPDQEDQQ